MGSPAQAANLAFRFVLELCTYVALALWGWHTGNSTPVSVVLALGAPVAFGVVWGVLVAPRAPRRLDDPARLILEAMLFALTALALFVSAGASVATVYAAAIVLSLALMFALHQRGM